ncbi:MAG: NUDIX hydrolase [Spirochaetia bacterium]|jgi:8-oxo-dGTP pyrophosphatase MutT (NUDIX family)|nr:NUDIX hydrolase [Spirochaetia bacterium]
MIKNKHLVWEQISRRLVKDFRIFKACDVESVSPEGKKSIFVQLDSPDWVNIVCAVKNDNDEECFLMVRQFRHGSASITLEFPAGLVDPGEEPVEAAARELLEETGTRAEKLVLIGKANPDPAFMNNICWTYLAVNPAAYKAQSLDEHELIDIDLVPVKKFEAEMGSGEFINAITVLAYTWYKKYRNEII